MWQPFDAANFIRIHQLVNKTNQFNLTTRRYTDAELRAVMQDADAFGLQFRLLDRLGDNGMIAVVIGRLQPDGDVALESWLMSCRVIGRRVEEAILPIVVEMARRRGSARLIGLYRPTSRNAMVAELYPGFGFTRLRTTATSGDLHCIQMLCARARRRSSWKRRSMPDAEIYAGLTTIFHELFGDATIVLRPETTARDIAGWDSLRMVLIAVAAEERFGIKLRARDLDRLAQVSDLVAAIRSQMNVPAVTPAALYLDLMKRVLTDTAFTDEPNNRRRVASVRRRFSTALYSGSRAHHAADRPASTICSIA
ncbi:MAG: phosphopantetheine-binding protein [Pseudomonadota bacterium]